MRQECYSTNIFSRPSWETLSLRLSFARLLNQFQMRMTFESLPYELLLDFFKYIPILHLFRCFSSLDKRCSELLTNQSSRISCRWSTIIENGLSLSLCEFLPAILNRVRSIHLSNSADDTPQQIDLFFNQDWFALQPFAQVQSLSLECLQSYNLLHQIINHCSSITSLRIAGPYPS